MARKENPSAKSRSAPSPLPAWKKPWIWFVGVVAAIALLLTNVNAILSNTRALPDEIRKTSDQFFDWYADYAGWKGKWSNYPEGRSNMAELRLTGEAFRLDIDDVGSGSLTGSIETKGICDGVPLFDRLLIEGNVTSSRHAKIKAFDYIGGHKRTFAALALQRNGEVMTVTPNEDPSALFAKESRIALDPDDLQASADREPICGNKRKQFIKRVLENASQKGT
ncbi:hypothetical protein [Sphingomonas sp. CFBP 8760]|uniref:hypothetical protein n=1 Tax=Sphingomonas sp. CFBP 8760 TaxID=2775282 RepID=UPI001785DC0D|nr:hypothetical protein [Sphingomonas sp. CFBP 8760]MBD8546854.1 hypothetical protein [Sphingomonas sp. CFBP 8760]